MVALRYTNPKHLREVLENQNEETADKILNELDKTILTLIPHLQTKEELNKHITNIQEYFRAVSEQHEVDKKKQSFYERTLHKILSPERTMEFLSTQIMMGLENMHDMNLVPWKYGYTRQEVGKLFVPTDPVARWTVDHIGDIWEVSVGFTAMRLGFAAINEALKSEQIKGLQKELFKNEKTKNIVGKVAGADRVEKWAAGENIQIPDDACFWASLVSTLTVTATHSLGMWAGPYNSHVGHPVPEMIFGQGVAAVVLAASHYEAKYREPIRNLALRAGKGLFNGLRLLEKKMTDFGISTTPAIDINTARQNK